MGLMAEPEHFSELFVNQMFLELLFISKEKIGRSPLLSFSFCPANQTTGGSCFASPCSCPPWELILNPGSLDPESWLRSLEFTLCQVHLHFISHRAGRRCLSNAGELRLRESLGLPACTAHPTYLLRLTSHSTCSQARLASQACDVWLRTETDAILPCFSCLPWILWPSGQIAWSPLAKSTASMPSRSRKSLPKWFEFC